MVLFIEPQGVLDYQLADAALKQLEDNGSVIDFVHVFFSCAYRWLCLLNKQRCMGKIYYQMHVYARLEMCYRMKHFIN